MRVGRELFSRTPPHPHVLPKHLLQVSPAILSSELLPVMHDIQICHQGFSPELPTSVGKCLWSISIWVFHGLLKSHMSQTNPHPLLNCVPSFLAPYFSQSTSIHWLPKAES